MARWGISETAVNLQSVKSLCLRSKGVFGFVNVNAFGGDSVEDPSVTVQSIQFLDGAN